MALCVAVSVAALVGSATAQASVGQASSGEPPFTKGTANTWFFGFTRILDVTAYAIGVSHDLQDDGLLSPVGDSGVVSTARSGLPAGSVQTECATEEIVTGDGTAGSSPPFCSATTMDDSRPTASLALDGGKSLTNDPRLAVRLNYADDTSYPWPAGSTFLCPSLNSSDGACRTGSSGQRVFTFDQGCSSPAGNVGPGGLKSSWGCTYDLSQLPGGAPDGTWYLCAVEADDAIPDNPLTADQYAGHTSDEANLSLDTSSACGSVTLDRTKPALTLSVTPRGGRAGAPVFIRMSVKDRSGVKDFVWHFGDGSPPLHGTGQHHRYKKPGRYRITAAATDGAGNVSRQSVVFHATQSGLLKPGCHTGHLRPSAPRRLAAGGRSVLLHFRPTCAGTVRMAVRRGRRVYARGTTPLTSHGSFSVRLPVPKLAAGTYELRVTFKPEGGPTGKVWTAPLRVGAKRARASAAHSTAHVARTTRGARALRPR